MACGPASLHLLYMVSQVTTDIALSVMTLHYSVLELHG